jgi:hypothetical protein
VRAKVLAARRRAPAGQRMPTQARPPSRRA